MEEFATSHSVQLEAVDLGIGGLCFVSNSAQNTSIPGWMRVISNNGYTVGHFVTHGPSFDYGNKIGFHLGQVDQLTFMAISPQNINGIFIDCRSGSDTLGKRVEIKFATSFDRKLIIPAGVAHTFRGINGVLTRNDLLLYCSPTNPKWKVEDDLVSFPIDMKPDVVEPADVNTMQLPLSAALLFYRLQAELIRGGRGGENDTLHSRSAHNFSDRIAHGAPPSPEIVSGGVQFRSNSFFPVGSDSWGIIPTTHSCVMHLCMVEGSADDSSFIWHQEHSVLHTFLDRRGETVSLDVIDIRQLSSGRFAPKSYTIACDERFHVFIPAGYAYRYRFAGHQLVRLETDILLADETENFGSHLADSHFLRPAE